MVSTECRKNDFFPQNTKRGGGEVRVLHDCVDCSRKLSTTELLCSLEDTPPPPPKSLKNVRLESEAFPLSPKDERVALQRPRKCRVPPRLDSLSCSQGPRQGGRCSVGCFACVFARARALRYGLLSAEGQLFPAASGVKAKLLLTSRIAEFGLSVFGRVQPLRAVSVGMVT